MRKQFWQFVTSIWHFVTSSPDVLTALVIGVSMPFLRFFNLIEDPIVLSAVAFILATLAFAILRDREARDKLLLEVHNLTSTLDMSRGVPTAKAFFRTRETLTPFSWESRLHAAKSVDVLGLSLTTLAITSLSVLENLKNSGARIRILVANPDNRFLQQEIADRIIEAKAADWHAGLVRTTLDHIVAIAGDTPSGGSVQVRVVNCIPTFSYIGTDTSGLKGKITIEVYLTQSALNRNPIFLLDAVSDPHWFSEFRNQFEVIWETAGSRQ